jgi:hypothetical protein
MDSLGSEQGPVAGSREHRNGTSGSIKCEEYLDQLRNYQFPNKNTVARRQLLVFHLHHECSIPLHPIPLDFVTLKVFGDGYKSSSYW